MIDNRETLGDDLWFAEAVGATLAFAFVLPFRARVKRPLGFKPLGTQ